MAETQEERLTRLGLFNQNTEDDENLDYYNDRYAKFKDADTIGDARIKGIDALETTHGQSGITAENKKRLEENKNLGLKFGQEGYRSMLQATDGDKASFEAELLSMKNIEEGPSAYRDMDVKYKRFDDSLLEPVVESTGDGFYSQPIEDREYDKYGRRLFDNPEYASELRKQGLAVNYNATDKEKALAEVLEAKKQKLGAWGYSPVEMEATFTKRNEGYNTYGEKEGESNVLDALQSSTSRLGGKIFEGIGESLEYLGKKDQEFLSREQNRLDEKYPGEKISNWRNELSKTIEGIGTSLSSAGGKIREGDIDEFYGYDKSGSKMTEKVWKNLKEGEILDAVKNVSASGVVSLIADSLPEMAMYANPATFGLVYAGNVAEAKKEAEKLNNNKEISNSRMSAILVGEGIAAGLQFFSLGKITGIGEIGSKATELASRFAGKVPDSILKEAAAYAIDKIKKVAIAAGAESLQEVAQEGQRILTTEYGQKDIATEANIDRLGQALIGGGLAGGGIRTGVEAGNVVKDAYEKLDEKGINAENAAILAKSGINKAGDAINKAREKPLEPVFDDSVEASEVLDENTKAVYETNFADAETRLEALTPLALREDVSNDEYMSGFEEIETIKQHIVDGMRSGTIDRARSDVAVAKLKDINAKMHAGATKMINSGDEQAMTRLFSDPETAERRFRSIATSGSEELDLDGANFMKAGFSAGLDEESIADIKVEAKALNALNGIVSSASGTEAGGTGKSMSKVAQEVSRDARGYLTYKEMADEGIDAGNVGKINKNLVSMEKFYGKHSAKLDSIDAGLNDAETRAEKTIDNFMKTRKLNRDEALTELTALDENKKPKYSLGSIEITYGKTENKGKINIIDSVRKLKDENYNGGMYSIRESVANETNAMGEVFELTKKRAERIGTFTNQFTDKTETDYENEIKNLEPEVVKLESQIKALENVPAELLNDSAKKLPEVLASKMKKLITAQDNLVKIRGTETNNKTETGSTTTPGSENKIPEVPEDIIAETPKDTVVKSFVKSPEESVTEVLEDPTEVNSVPKDTNVSFVVPEDKIEIPKDYTVNTFVPPLEQEITKMVDNEYGFVQAEQTFVEPEDIPTIDDIAKFDNIDSISDKTDKEKAVKSKVIKQLEESLENAKAKLAMVKEKYSKGREAVNKLIEKRKAIIDEYGNVSKASKEIKDEYFGKIDPINEKIEKAFEKLDDYVEKAIIPSKNLVNGLVAKLSGSAEIESILNDTGLNPIVGKNSVRQQVVKTEDKNGNFVNAKTKNDKGETVDLYQSIQPGKIVNGNKKSGNRLSASKIEDITDNNFVLQYADDAVKTLAGVIDSVEKAGTEGFAKDAKKTIKLDKQPTIDGKPGNSEAVKLRDSLFRGILFNADGSINRNVATAIAMTGDEYRAIMASKLYYNDKASIAKMLGITEGEVTGLMTRTMAFNGSFKKLIADDLSTTLFKNLAISGVDTADKELVAKMKADAGQIVLLYMQEKGYIEPLATSTMSVEAYKTMTEQDEDFVKESFSELGESENGATIPMVRLAGTRDTNGKQIRLKGKAKEDYDKKFATETAKLTNTLKVLGATFGIESTKKGYKTKPTKTESKKVKNSKVNNMSDEALETINVSQAEAFGMNGGVEVLFEFDKNGNRLIDDATIIKAMGYKTEAELKGKSFNTIESAEARNMEIINSLEELKSLRARVLDPEDEMTNEMHFDYFFGKNGRFYMDSVGINPQTEKQLHRWLITPRAHKTTIDIKSEDDKDIKKVKMFKLAIAQAFGFAIDKKANAKAYALAEAIMAADESELLKVLKPDSKGKFEHTFTGSDGKSHTLNIEHIGHTMQAISALRDYRASGGTKFETTMSIEFDAVTSGFIIKLMQLPILKDMKQVKAWLAKGGVFLGGQDGITIGDEQSFNPDTWDKLKSMSDIIDNNWITDAYRTLAGKMKTPKKVDGKFYSNGKNNVFANNLLVSMIPMLGEIKDIDEQVTKEGRALFKDPFMTFNYAAGMASIKRSLGYNMTESFADEMLDKESAKGNALIAALHGRELNAKELSDFREQLLTKDFDEVFISEKGKRDVKVSELMRKIIEDAYGTQVENILNDEFGPLVKANTIINNSFKGVFLAWKKAYEAEVAKVKKEGGVLSAKVEDEIILALKDKFPMINAPLSSGNIEDLETVAIYSTKLQSGKDKRYGAAKTYINKDNANNPKGQQTLTVQSMIREFEAAMSAGAVIPIHYIDGSFMTRVLRASGILGVHDAIVVGIDGAFQAVKDYNKNVYENSRDYSVIEELHKLVSRNIKGNEDIVVIEAKGKNPAVTFSEIFNELTNLNSEVKDRREILFDTDVKVMHMTAIEGTEFENKAGKNGNKVEKPIVEHEKKENAVKESTSGSEEIVKESVGLTVTKSGLVRYKGTNKSQKKIESYAEFKSIVSEYASIMNSKKAEGDKTTDAMNKYVDSMFEMLANSGIKFRPFELKFSKNVGDNDSGLGLHKTYDGGLTIITMPFDVDFGNESPLRVVLHEYAHSITKKAMKDNPSLMKKANELIDHAIKKLKENGMTQDEINKIYAFSDKKNEAYEFIAEALTSPKFQVMLNKIPSVSENKNVFEDIKKFFNAIVKFVTKNDESKFEINSVLADTLNLILEIQNENGLLNKDYNSEPDGGPNSNDDIALINESLDIMKTLKENSTNGNIKAIIDGIIKNIEGCN